MTDWQNRIIGLEHIPANQLLAHPNNARRHPGKQREALRGSLDTLGWYDAVIYNKRTGYLIDGHARVEEQLTRDENAMVPVLVVDLTEAEEAQALASHDWITQLAEYDRTTLEELLHKTNSDESRVQAMLSEMAESFNLSFSKIGELNIDMGSAAPGETPVTEPLANVASSVRMVSLYFNSDNIQEVQRLIAELTKRFETSNPTDTVLEALRYAYNSR